MGRENGKRKIYFIMSIVVVFVIGLLLSGCRWSDISRYLDAPKITGDNKGGAITVWLDESNNLCAQRINTQGECLWGKEGIEIVTNKWQPQGGALVAGDSNGGAVVTWVDNRHGNKDILKQNIYTQKLDSQGNLLWSEGINISLNLSDSEQYYVGLIGLVADGYDGAIILWYEEKIHFPQKSQTIVYAQRIDMSGHCLWGQGRQICDTSPDPRWAKLVSDGSGGAIIVWEDSRRDDYDIYAQRINFNGDFLWSNDGISLADFEGAQIKPEIISTGADSFIVAWLDSGSSQYDIGENQIVVQKINLNGEQLWAKEGVRLSSTSFSQGNQTGHHLSTDGSGGCIVVWHDDRDRLNRDVYAQRLNYQGSRLWGNDGVLIWNRAGIEESSLRVGSYDIKTARDNNSNVIVVWQVNPEAIAVSGFRGGQIYAQKLSVTGELLWGANGLRVYNNPSLRSQGYSSVVSDGMGGIIISSRVGKSNVPNLVYAQRIDSNGRLLWGEGGSG